MIQAEHLSKTYVLKEKSHLFGKKKVRQISAVRDISLEIPKGKITGVLGINGAGKTTTIRMLASLITPTSGSLTMDGVDAVKNHLWVKERINMISGGERNLYWRLTAQENPLFRKSVRDREKRTGGKDRRTSENGGTGGSKRHSGGTVFQGDETEAADCERADQ